MARQHEVAQSRARVYHALAEALVEPPPDLPDLLARAASQATGVLGSAACRRAAGALSSRPGGAGPALGQRYSRLFANPGGRPLAMHESLHRQGRLLGRAAQEVENCYQAMGVTPAGGELPDHASLELAFLGHLVDVEAGAWLAGDQALASRSRAAQRRFLIDHAATWLPELGRQMASTDDAFYAEVGRLLSGFLAEEVAAHRPARRALRLPALAELSACTLCGLCTGRCPAGALWVAEDEAETVLVLDPGRCNGCARCLSACPEGVLALVPAAAEERPDTGPAQAPQVMRRSARACCPRCGRPTVSQAELQAIFRRLQPDPAMQRSLGLCIECKAVGSHSPLMAGR